MRAQRIITATESAALLVNSAGDLLSSSDPTLPRPKVVVGIMLFYGSLGLVGSFGRGPSRFAAAAGVVAFVTSVVVGPGGQHMLQLLQRTTTLVGGEQNA